jgi:competence protein ComEC
LPDIKKGYAEIVAAIKRENCVPNKRAACSQCGKEIYRSVFAQEVHNAIKTFFPHYTSPHHTTIHEGGREYTAFQKLNIAVPAPFWYACGMIKSRVFLWILLSFITGVAVRSFFIIPSVVLVLILIGGAIELASGFSRKRKMGAVAGLLVLVFVGGVIRMDFAERAKPDLSQWYGKTVAWSGIADDPQPGERSQKIRVSVATIGNHLVASPFFILITVPSYPPIKRGDRLRIIGKFEEPSNTGDFDYRAYLAHDQIFAIMSFPHVEKISEARGYSIHTILGGIKHAFEENIDAALPEPHAAFLKGLLLGERTALPQKLLEDFKITGTTHIIALSGYNITIVSRVVSTALLMLGVSFYAAFWVATVGIVLFVLMVGASASVTRAAVMGILLLIALREGRMYQMTNALVFAGTMMILFDPFLLRFDAAFQLSFLSTLGLIYFSLPIERQLNRFWNKLVLLFTGHQKTMGLIQSPTKDAGILQQKIVSIKHIFIETLAAQLMVLPLLIWLFGSVSLISPLTNILVLLAVPGAMAFGFITGMFGFLWQPLGGIIGVAAWLILEYIIRVITLFAKIPWASVELGKWVLVPLMLGYGFIVIRILLHKAGKRR